MVKNQKGITLVELLAVLAISSLVMGLVMQFFFVNFNSINYQQVSTELQREAAITFEVLQKYGYSAKNIEYIENESITFCDTEKITTFTIEDGELKQNKRTIARAIQEIDITQAGDLVTFNITFARPNGKNPVTYNESTTIRMRNYEEEFTCQKESN